MLPCSPHVSASRHGIKYTGQWKGGLRDGHGLQEWPDGAQFEGLDVSKNGIYHENTSAKWRISFDFSIVFEKVNGGMALRKGMANLCTPMVRKTQQAIEWISFFFVKVILVAQISICFEGDVYEGQWKGDKANGEGGGRPGSFSPQPSLPSIERCVSPC